MGIKLGTLFLLSLCSFSGKHPTQILKQNTVLNPVFASACHVPAITCLSNASGNYFDTNPKAFVPAGYQLLAEENGDLNLDFYPDKILVFSPPGEDSLSTQEKPLLRLLVMLYGTKNKQYEKALQHENLVCYYNYDPNFKDAFTGVGIEKGSFTISHYGGMAERWGRSTTFKFHAAENKWLLESDEFTTFMASDEKNTTSIKTLTHKDFGKVYLEQFSIYTD
jgi:hypothetical protein